MDQCTRECLVLLTETSISGQRVVSELENLIDYRGLPLCIVSDNGSEFISKSVLIISTRICGLMNGDASLIGKELVWEPNAQGN